MSAMIVAVLLKIIQLMKIIERLFEEIYDNYGPQSVKYRQTIVLRHVKTKRLSHSHLFSFAHPGTSGQQQVTASVGFDTNDYWIVKVPHGQPEFDKAGEPVRHGDVIRLEHLNTHVNLHSHRNYPSPITGQQEVTGFGHAENGDGHDNWRVEVYCRGIWYVGRKIKLIHVDTNHALHSHAGFYVGEQQEVTCFHDRDANDWWKVTR